MRPDAVTGHRGAIRQVDVGQPQPSGAAAHLQALAVTLPPRPRLGVVGAGADHAARALVERRPAAAVPPPAWPTLTARPPPSSEATPNRMVHQPADPNAVPWNRAREAEWWRAVDELCATLRALAPFAFDDVPTSLAIGIDRDITARMADAADEATISRFLARWTRRPAYVRAIAAGNVRRDLGGNPTGEAMAEQRESAAEHLAACGAA